MVKSNRIEHMRCIALVYCTCSAGVGRNSWEEAVLHSLCFPAQIVLSLPEGRVVMGEFPGCETSLRMLEAGL